MESLEILSRLGFQEETVDVMALARRQIGVSGFSLGAKYTEAPEVVSCATFIKWLFARLGIWLPRRAIQQSYFGMPVLFEEIREGDLVFSEAQIKSNSYYLNPNEGIGHVSMVTSENSVIYASNCGSRGVTETDFKEFIGKRGVRCIRRILPNHRELFRTLICPGLFEVECSDDIQWILFSCPFYQPLLE
ncbi:MAG: NlpC/P60 family protein [Candidatus Vogelbacteria bacterium]|nr:NlpC/P60 family protein [Candidatus Vogelbacteria bacterium]